jgi:hypothetical protein
MTTSKPPRRRSSRDPAVALAARLARYARQLDPDEHRVLEAMLVMAMDPLDRQSRRLAPALTDEEAKTVARLRRND